MGTEKEPKIKREPVAVRMNVDVIALARSAARSEYGDENKLGLWLEDAVQAYAVQKMDDTKTAALLKIIEESLFSRISVEIENMHKSFTTRDNRLEDRLSKLLAVSTYESCLTEAMLKDTLYTKDSKSKQRYEELRSAAARAMKVTEADHIARLSGGIERLTTYLKYYKQALAGCISICAASEGQKNLMQCLTEFAKNSPPPEDFLDFVKEL